MNQTKSPLPTLVQNKQLSSISTLGIGGPAKFFLEVRCESEMQAAFAFCKDEKIPFFILGKGSNSLFDDKGFNGCVIHNKIDFLNQDGSIFHVGAGYSFSRLGTHTAKLGYSGLEFASGIPASIGGAVFMNAGANGSETKDCLLTVDFMDTDGAITQYSKAQIQFNYRFSSFQSMQGAILSASFSLNENKQARSKQMEIIHYRQKTQPYSDKSLGCVFRNPVTKPAGLLIDECGLKGYSVGNASVSTLHGNFLINDTGATSSEFKELIKDVQNKVKEKTGTTLECEIRMIPYEL